MDFLGRGVIGAVFLLATGGFALPADPTPLSRLNATPGDPVYTTYTAPSERSTYVPDEGYHLVYFDSQPLKWQTDTAGTLTASWREGDETVEGLSQYSELPILRRSYADCAELVYAPFPELRVSHRFAVYSSAFLIHELIVTNRSSVKREPHLRLRLDLGQPMGELDVPRALDQVFFRHREPPESWAEERLRGVNYELDNILLTRPAFTARLLDREGAPLSEDALTAFRKRRRSKQYAPWGVALDLAVTLPPGKEVTIRLVRGIGSDSQIRLWAEAERLLTEVRMAELFEAAERRLESVPRLAFADHDSELVYWQAFSFMQQMWLPAEGDLPHDYFVSAREPTWGASHEGQSLTESLMTPGFARLDLARALDSQRVYIERQLPDGWLPSRAGPYPLRESMVKGRRTAAPPFFNWITWELFGLSGDPKFLAQAHESGSRFVRYLMRSRDRDGDGLFEWGGDAARESGRSEFNVIWQSLGGRPVSPGLVEALDLNCLLVREMDSLARSAAELGRTEEAGEWQRLRGQLSDNIRQRMWDPETGFFYHVDRDNGTFVSAKGVDLRRMEIIGFLPLWAGIATPEQTRRLLQHLTDPGKFWRNRGIPSLAADDPGFDPRVDQCCKWNGPVRLPWNYLIFRGLLEHGYREEARELARRLYAAAAERLRIDHQFWESFSPDLGAITPHVPAIGSGILVRMRLDLSTETSAGS